jgi:glycosyltransferase involved in cell wall biosynthesis
MKPKKLVIIIPAYNEQKTIKNVVALIPSRIAGVSKITIVVIDDGSNDKTARFAKESGCIVISHHKNMGVGSALQTGLEKALDMNTDIAVNIDADRQFNPKDIPAIIKPILGNKTDVVVADRFTTSRGLSARPRNMSPYKYYGNKAMTRLINFLAKEHYTDVSSGFRAYNKEAILNLNLSGNFTYTQEMFLNLTFKGLRIVNLPVKVKYFKNRKSKVANDILRYTLKSLKIIIRAFRNYKPLLFFFYLSIPPFILGILLLSFLLINYMNTRSFTPYKFLGFISIYSFSIMLILWIIGFLADMFIRIRANQEKIIYLLKKGKNR